MTPTEKLLEAAKGLSEFTGLIMAGSTSPVWEAVTKLRTAIAEFEAQEREPRESWPATLREIANGLGYTNTINGMLSIHGWSQALRLIADGIEQPTTARR